MEISYHTAKPLPKNGEEKRVENLELSGRAESELSEIQAQQLSEISLSNVRDQFPVETIEITDSNTNKQITIGTAAINQIRDLIIKSRSKPLSKQEKIQHPLLLSEQEKHISEEEPITTLAPDPSWINSLLPGGHIPLQAINNLQNLKLESGFRDKALTIGKPLSLETLQGKVYAVEIKPHPDNVDTYAKSGLPVKSLHEITAKSGWYDTENEIYAVMKKSPIYNVDLWFMLHALQMYQSTEQQLAGQIVTRNKLRNYIEKLLVESVAAYNLLYPLDLNNPQQVTNAIKKLDIELKSEYQSPQHPAYVDAMGYFLGSKLVETGISCFYPLLYSTFLAKDESFFPASSEAATILGAETINKNFPIQVTIMEALDGDIDKLYRTDWFIDNETGKPNIDKLSSFIFQTVAGMAQGQRFFSLVHNDAHSGNIMYKEEPKNTIIFYRHTPYMINNNFDQEQNFYAIPTYGFVFKEIDFGRAAFKIGNVLIRSDDYAEGGNAPRGWEFVNPESDLVRFVAYLLRYVPINDIDTSTTRGQEIVSFINGVMTIVKENGKPVPINENSLIKRYNDCVVRAGNNLEQQRECFTQEMILRPATGIYSMNPKTPLDWVSHFKSFMMTKNDIEKIPKDAAVYPV